MHQERVLGRVLSRWQLLSPSRRAEQLVLANAFGVAALRKQPVFCQALYLHWGKKSWGRANVHTNYTCSPITHQQYHITCPPTGYRCEISKERGRACMRLHRRHTDAAVRMCVEGYPRLTPRRGEVGSFWHHSVGGCVTLCHSPVPRSEHSQRCPALAFTQPPSLLSFQSKPRQMFLISEEIHNVCHCFHHHSGRCS